MLSREDRIEIWRYAYARSALNVANASCDLLLSQNEFPEEIRKAIFTQMIIAYARPFTKSQFTKNCKKVPLEKATIPSNFKEAHASLIGIRDQVIGHSDANLSASTIVNKVLLRFEGNTVDLHTILIKTIDTHLVGEVKSLCESLISFCNNQLSPYLNKILKSGTVKHGLYVMSTEDIPAWLQKLK